MAKPRGKLTFEDALAKLDEIVDAMESGQIGIEESVTRYEEAMQLAAHCRSILEHAEQRIRVIESDQAGGLLTREFTPAPGAAETPPVEPDPDDLNTT